MTSTPEPRTGPRVFTVPYAAIVRCPIGSLSASHYDEDGCCGAHPGDTALCEHCGDGIRFDPTSRDAERWVHIITGRQRSGLHKATPRKETDHAR